MQNRFSIGEMAKLHQTTVKTLRYYDQIGLFKPAETAPQSGYRYYTTAQFERLNTIQYLQALGLSLKEIQAHLAQPDIGTFRTLLQEQEHLADQRIQELIRMKRRFHARLQDLDEAQRVDQLETPVIQTLPARQIVTLTQPIRSEPDLELALRHLATQAGLAPAIFIGGVGLTISRENILARHFHSYQSVFILVPESVTGPLAGTLPGGDYACIYYNGNHQQSRAAYETLLTFVQTAGYQITGDAVERTVIDQYVSKNTADYLTTIQLPIQR